MSSDRPQDWQTVAGGAEPTHGSQGLSAQRRGIAPRQIGPYRVIRPLAHGAMGAVFEVEHPESKIRYALKAPHSAEWAEDLERFRREALALAKIEHPNVVRIHDARLDGDRPYLVEDLLPKGSLDQRLKERGALPVEEAVAIATKVARGLAAAHAIGMLHRDIKPSNILFDDRDEPRLADFGLVSEQQQVHRLTVSGQLLGTPAFMAPEQALGKTRDVDARTDVYAVGVLLYTLLRGRAPFAGPLYEVLDKVATQSPPSLLDERPDIPPGVVQACARAMAKKREDRHPTAEALALALETCLVDEARPAGSRKAAWGIAAGACAVALVAGVLASAKPGAEKAAPIDTTPPSLTLSSPREGLEVWGDEVAIEGRVSPDDPASISLRVDGRSLQPTWSGRTFRATVRLSPEQTRVDVSAIDAAGNGASATRTLARPPAWFMRTPADARPPSPLPFGLRFGDGPGEYVNEKDGSVLVWIPPGSFPMGGDRYPPRRTVTITRGYFLGKYEVSWAQYRRYCEATKARVPSNVSELPTGPRAAPDTHPVFRVSWEECVAYCDWAGLRLPTEAEWEKGAAGPEGSRYPWGNHGPGPTHVNLRDASTQDAFGASEAWSDGEIATAPVDAFADGASHYGCVNMVGNITEWVADVYADPDPSDVIDPRGPRSGPGHVVKSGSFKLRDKMCRSAFRATWKTSEVVGFRVCRSP